MANMMKTTRSNNIEETIIDPTCVWWDRIVMLRYFVSKTKTSC